MYPTARCYRLINLATAISLICCEVYFYSKVLASHCVFSPRPPNSLSPFVSLFSVHKCNPLNLKSFPARVNECNYKPTVPKPREHMNKSGEGERGENAEGAGEQNWIFLPLRSPCYPEKVIGLTHGVAVGSLAWARLYQTRSHQNQREVKINGVHPLTNGISCLALCIRKMWACVCQCIFAHAGTLCPCILYVFVWACIFGKEGGGW